MLQMFQKFTRNVEKICTILLENWRADWLPDKWPHIPPRLVQNPAHSSGSYNVLDQRQRSAALASRDTDAEAQVLKEALQSFSASERSDLLTQMLAVLSPEEFTAVSGCQCRRFICVCTTCENPSEAMACTHPMMMIDYMMTAS